MKEAYSLEITCMLTPLLKKAAFAKEASRKYQHQSILATAWKLEELRRHIDLMESFQVENKDRFDIRESMRNR